MIDAAIDRNGKKKKRKLSKNKLRMSVASLACFILAQRWHAIWSCMNSYVKYLSGVLFFVYVCLLVLLFFKVCHELTQWNTLFFSFKTICHMPYFALGHDVTFWKWQFLTISVLNYSSNFWENKKNLWSTSVSAFVYSQKYIQFIVVVARFARDCTSISRKFPKVHPYETLDSASL